MAPPIIPSIPSAHLAFSLNREFFLRHEFNILKERFKTFNNKSMFGIPTVSDYKLNIQKLLSQCLKEKEFEGKSELILEMSAFQIKLKKHLESPGFPVK